MRQVIYSPEEGKSFPILTDEEGRLKIPVITTAPDYKLDAEDARVDALLIRIDELEHQLRDFKHKYANEYMKQELRIQSLREMIK